MNAVGTSSAVDRNEKTAAASLYVGQPRIIVAIPACNEEARIAACLSALALQRTGTGAPLPERSFEILIFANNCSDATVGIASAIAAGLPQTVIIHREQITPASAGLARKRAMDLAAERLEELSCVEGLILTTDADSCVAPTWVSSTLDAFQKGIDCVAGYVDGEPLELVRLGAAFLARGRGEDEYLAKIAELQSLCDPRPHDPWPNHRVSSGASLAVTSSAYRAVGGLPALDVGEDAALTAQLERHGFKVRHSLDVTVRTSCRLDGRAAGGAADTMRLRHEVPNAPCDDELEPAFAAARRFLWRRYFRIRSSASLLARPGWADRLAIPRAVASSLALSRDSGFSIAWEGVQAASAVLQRRLTLRPSCLAREAARAEMIIRAMRLAPGAHARNAQGGRFHRAGRSEPAEL